MRKPPASGKLHTPNRQLREERERRSLSLKDVAERIGAPDPHMVGRWERGVSVPHPHYRQGLCQLFGKSAEELGLYKARPTNDSRDEEANRPLWLVPAQLKSFIGRENDLEAVHQLLLSPSVRLINLTGPGGVGKTSLSIELAYRVREDFIDGVCFVSLAALTDPMLVLQTILQMLGASANRALSILEQLKTWLHNKNFLLVLDNFEQVVIAAPALEALIAACPRLKILVTSREVLHLHIEQEFALAPMAVPDLEQLPEPEILMQFVSVKLFVQRAQTHLPGFRLTVDNARTVAEICARLDGLPLAIELAATRIKLLPPHALLAQLSHGLHLLKSSSRSLPERQQTLHNTITWSYTLLDEQEQRLFRQLAIFRGGCTLEAIEAIFNSEQTLDIIHIAASLIDKSLLQQKSRDGQTPYFILLETLREYGLEQLETHGELHTCQHAHAMYYLTLMEQVRPYLNSALQAAWLERLEQDIENLRAALAWLIRHEKAEALYFCDAFGKFCGLRGYWTEEQHWLHAVLSLPAPVEVQAIRARVLRRAGHLAYRLRNLTQARNLLEESIAISRELGDAQNLAGALSGLGWVLYRQKDIGLASQLLHESVTSARKAGDKWAIANTLESLARLLYFQGDVSKAHLLLDESVALSREVGDKESLARILTTFVTVALNQGEVAHAEELAQESYLLAQELGTKPLKALTLNSLGDVAMAQGAYKQAAHYFETRITLAREMGDLPSIALKQLHLGEIALYQGQIAQAAKLARESLNFFRSQSDNLNAAHALCILGDSSRMSKEFETATTLYIEAFQLEKEAGYESRGNTQLIGLAMVALEQKSFEQAAYLFGLVSTKLQPHKDMHPAQRLNYEQAIAYVRTQLGEEIFTAIWSQGENTPFSEAMADILKPVQGSDQRPEP
jgi:predicted ATPase